ncbi:MAG: glycerol-3-phosphate dehydrogenase subunit GlpB [Desulfobacteraceae bacterium]|jgi:glycerol-3-phosphate dehydrogenase subunit B
MTAKNPDFLECELLVIGRGMAGMAAALFAANRGISAIQVGMTGGLIFASGLLDLLGAYPPNEKRPWDDPWAGIDLLVQDDPNHPYARLKREEIQGAFDEISSFLEEYGLPYCCEDSRNSQVMTPAGTIKRTYCVPKTMWNGVQALKEKPPCLLVDFMGLHDFSAQQIVATMRDQWPHLRSARLPFPSSGHMKDLITGEMTAQALELSKNQERLIKDLQPYLKDVQALGMPAIFGLKRSHEIVSDFGERIGVPVFEIPTLPISIPGLRLNDTFTRGLSAKGVKSFHQYQVLEVSQSAHDNFQLTIGRNLSKYRVQAKAIVLASGRFLGRGLKAERKRVYETIFDLPLYQPADRNAWHRPDFLDPEGHPINQAGVEIDNNFKPLDRTGRPVYQNLFAAGSILAHQDWMRLKCGSGLAIATAYGAVNAFIRTG